MLLSLPAGCHRHPWCVGERHPLGDRRHCRHGRQSSAHLRGQINACDKPSTSTSVISDRQVSHGATAARMWQQTESETQNRTQNETGDFLWVCTRVCVCARAHVCILPSAVCLSLHGCRKRVLPTCACVCVCV